MRGFTQPLDGPELAQQQILPVLAHPGTIIQNTFADPLLHEQLVISVGETMRFIANSLQ